MNVTTAERSKEKPMSIFTIDADNNITAHASSQEAILVEGAVQFASQANLATVSADWPVSRLAEISNGIPGNTEVSKFADRKKAVGRIWKAIQRLAGDAQPEPEAKPKKAAKGAKPGNECTWDNCSASSRR